MKSLIMVSIQSAGFLWRFTIIVSRLMIVIANALGSYYYFL